jgi:hypothetical protein
MEPDLTQERQQAHALLDMLSAEKLNAVRNLPEVMVEPLSRSLAVAPAEDEEITPKTAVALDRARASLARGEGIPHQTASGGADFSSRACAVTGTGSCGELRTPVALHDLNDAAIHLALDGFKRMMQDVVLFAQFAVPSPVLLPPSSRMSWRAKGIAKNGDFVVIQFKISAFTFNERLILK